MHSILPIAGLVDYLADAGYISAERAEKLQADVVMLLRQNFSPEHIVGALFNWDPPEVQTEVKRFMESREEHERLVTLRITKRDLLERMRPLLNGEWPDIVTAFQSVSDDSLLTADQVRYHLPDHHPKATSAMVTIYLGHAKAGATSC